MTVYLFKTLSDHGLHVAVKPAQEGAEHQLHVSLRLSVPRTLGQPLLQADLHIPPHSLRQILVWGQLNLQWLKHTNSLSVPTMVNIHVL